MDVVTSSTKSVFGLYGVSHSHISLSLSNNNNNNNNNKTARSHGTKLRSECSEQGFHDQRVQSKSRQGGYVRGESQEGESE